MISLRSETRTVLTVLVLTFLLVPTTVAAATAGAPVGDPVEGVLTIATGSDQTVDGFLSVTPDDYGQWASVTFTGGGDIFNPAGAPGPIEATFTSAFFLAVPNRLQHIVLTDNPSYTAIADDGSLTLAVTSPLVASDTDGDSVDDTLMSSFTAMGTDTALDFDLVQEVVSGDPGVAAMRQVYTITNTAALAVDLTLARVYDGDLLWDGDFSNDQVGTGTNAAGGDLFVFEQEASDPATTITLSSPSAISYFGGKNGVQPAGGPPPYNFGTDTEVFDAFGVPASWVNHIAGVGYDTDGVSGIAPPGSVPPEDGFIGLGFAISLAPGASTTVTVIHTYGQESPLGGDADLSIVKTNDAGGDAEIGSLVDYTLVVTNNGPDDATAVEVADDLPAEVTYVADNCGGVNGPPWSWTVGNLAAGDSASCDITVSADVLGTAVNTAIVAGDENDPDPANNASTSTFNIVERVDVIEIPTLGAAGFAVLALLLGALGVRRLRRRG